MADYQHHDLKSEEPYEAAPAPAPVNTEEIKQPVETTDRGLFDFIGKKKETEADKKCEDDAIVLEFGDKVQVSDERKEEPRFEVCEEKKEEPRFEVCEEKKEEPRFEFCEEKEEEPKEEKKHESLLEKLHRSSSSSSSSSDEEEVEEGGDRKKKKKGLKEKIKEKVTGDKKEEETSVPVEKCDEIPTYEPDEKKGFLDKIKEKLPGGKKTEEVSAPPPHKKEVSGYATTPETESNEKKGFLNKIKEKLPGYHHKGEEAKEKEKGEEACH